MQLTELVLCSDDTWMVLGVFLFEADEFDLLCYDLLTDPLNGLIIVDVVGLASCSHFIEFCISRVQLCLSGFSLDLHLADGIIICL